MKYFRQFISMPAMALCAAMLVFSACSKDTPEVAGPPAISTKTAAVSRAGIAIPVSVLNADNIHYAALLKAADATTDPVPAPADYKTLKVTELANETLLIPISELQGLGEYRVYTYVSSSTGQTEPAMTKVTFTEDKFEKLLTFEVKNVSAYTLDVDVKASALCDKYVTTIFKEKVVKEVGFMEDFTSRSRESINPSAAQQLDGMQPFKVYSESAVVPEAMLAKNTKYDTDACEGVILERLENDTREVISYVVATFGIDKFGNESVYLSEAFELPEATFGTSPSVEIIPSTTFTKIDAAFKAPADCAKIVYGSLFAIVKGSSSGNTPCDENTWKDKKLAEAYILGMPSLYTPIANSGVLSANYRMKLEGQPENKVVVYAIAIKADGKIGGVSYTVQSLQSPVLSGEAKVTYMAAVSKNFDRKLFWDVAFSNNTTAVRFLVCDQDRFADNYAGSTEKEMHLRWVLVTDESADGYGDRRELTEKELALTNYVYNTGDLPYYDTKFVIRAIARDAAGKWGEIYAGPDQFTKPAPVVDMSIDYTKGTGEATLTVVSMTQDEVDPSYPSDIFSSGSYSVVKGSNTKNIYRAMITGEGTPAFQSEADFTVANLQARLKARFNKTWISNQTPLVEGRVYDFYGLANFSFYGADFHAIITEDNSGNFKVAAVCVGGVTTPVIPTK